jgi:hypothetical protein
MTEMPRELNGAAGIEKCEPFEEKRHHRWNTTTTW